MARPTPQRWELTAAGRQHSVEVAGSYTRTVRWSVDGELVASAQGSGDRFRLRPGDRRRGGRAGAERPELGVLEVRFTALGRPRRVTWHERDGRTSRLGGLDLDPEAGSAAARREERIRRHPLRFAAVATAAAAVRVGVPVLLGLLAVQLLPDLPLPDVDVPWPQVDLPAVPWPDVDLPDGQLPAWVRRAAGVLQHVWPVLLAAGLAAAELRRRRVQDERKRQQAAVGEPPA